MTRPRPDVHVLQIPDAEFVVCDVETTGLSAEKNRLTEIALFRIRAGAVVDSYSSLVNPRQFIPAEISRLTGITNDMVYDAPDADVVMPAVRKFIGDAIFAGHNVRFDRSFVDAALRRAGADPLDVPNLCTARLARRLITQKGSKSLGDVARQLGIRVRSRHRAAGDAEATAEVLLRFLRILEEDFDITVVADLLSFQNRPVYRVTGPPKHLLRLKEQLEGLPHEPGVYTFRDKRSFIIYVGKARDLRDRVHSYFYHNIGHTEKVQRLVKAVHEIEWKTTGTELSALLLESQMIKEHQPRFNTMLKNYRAYPFIRIDMADSYPTLTWCYEPADDEADYFGPFRSRYAVEEALDAIDRLFMLRECEGPLKPHESITPCLYFEIKRCAAPCAVLQSREEYLQEVDDAVQFLQGEHGEVLDRMRGSMEKKAEMLDFEGAAALRDRLAAIDRIVRQQRLMVFSIRKQNLIVITLARKTLVELHFIRQGRLASTMTVDQRSFPAGKVRRMMDKVFSRTQTELFGLDKADINEMRIIASWCLTRDDESTVVEYDRYGDAEMLLAAVEQAVIQAGKQESVRGAGPEQGSV